MIWSLFLICFCCRCSLEDVLWIGRFSEVVALWLEACKYCTSYLVYCVWRIQLDNVCAVLYCGTLCQASGILRISCYALGCKSCVTRRMGASKCGRHACNRYCRGVAIRVMVAMKGIDFLLKRSTEHTHTHTEMVSWCDVRPECYISLYICCD